MNKDKKSIWFRNIIFGSILAVIPILMIDLKDMILGKYYNLRFLSYIIKGLIKYGSLGVIISLVYTYFYNLNQKISKILILIIIIVYYIIAIAYFVAGIYFYSIGPLFG